MERRALWGLIFGVAGLIFGLVAAATGQALLGIGSGLLAAVAGVASLPLLNKVQEAEKMIAGAAAVSALRDIQLTEHHEHNTESPVGKMVDQESGLPDEDFFHLALDSRLAAARRRLWPISIVEIEIVVRDATDEERLRDVILTFAGIARLTLRGSDIACRVGPRSFALVLEDTDEKGAELAVDRLCAALEKEHVGIRRFVAGISSYPNHGLTSQDVMAQAWTALAKANSKEEGRDGNYVEVAKVEQDAEKRTLSGGAE